MWVAANQDGPLIWSFHIVELQTSSHNLQCSHLKLESPRTCNSNLKLVVEMTNKCCYCEGLEIDIMHSFFKFFILQAPCVELHLGIFVLFFYALYCFPKLQSPTSKSHCNILDFSWVLQFWSFVFFLYNRILKSSWFPYCHWMSSLDYSSQVQVRASWFPF